MPVNRKVRVRVCLECGGFLDCRAHLESLDKPPEGFIVNDKRFVIDVPGHRDVSMVYGGGCECEDNARRHDFGGLPDRAFAK